jgi:hypothetical protein
MDFLKLLRAFLSTAYKLTDAEIDALLTASDVTEDKALAGLLEKDRTRIQPFQGKFQEGVNKGTKDTWEKIETELRKKYGIEDQDLKGQDLIDHVVTIKSAPAGNGGNPSELTEELIRKSPAFATIERAHKKALADKEKEWEDKYNKAETQHKRGQVMQTVSGKALSILDTLNPVLPKDQKVASTWKSNFVKSLEGYDFDVQEDGTIVPMKDGKVLVDAHGHNLDFEKLVKETAGSYFEFQQNNGGGNAGNGKPGEGGSGTGGTGKPYPAGITKPKTIEELAAIMDNPNLKLEERQTVFETWEAENKAGTQ